jgi:hypothetical protein
MIERLRISSKDIETETLNVLGISNAQKMCIAHLLSKYDIEFITYSK